MPRIFHYFWFENPKIFCGITIMNLLTLRQTFNMSFRLKNVL
jgi:hypothetical protein